MTSTQKTGISSDRVHDVSRIGLIHLECSICHDVLWKPVACQSCETPFCSTCIKRWLANNPNKCPNKCESYQERKCPPFIAKLLAELQISCFYKSTDCQQIVSYEALDKHETECDYQSRQCFGCQLQILKKDFDNHTSSCVSVELTCEDCKLVYKRGEAATKHAENICLKEQVRQMKEEFKKNKSEIHAENMRFEEQLRQVKEESKKNKSEIHAENICLKEQLRQVKEDFKKNKVEIHAENICLKEQLRQIKEESKKNKSEIQAVTFRLHDLRTFNPSLGIVKITFDDLSNAIEETQQLPRTYRGLRWTQLSYAHERFFNNKYPNSGYAAAFTSGCGCSPQIAYFKEQASIAIERLNKTFTFVSITACAAWADGLKLTITGYRNSTQTNTHTTTLLFGQPQVTLLQWKDIEQITLESSGGTLHPGTGSWGGTYVVITQ